VCDLTCCCTFLQFRIKRIPDPGSRPFGNREGRYGSLMLIVVRPLPLQLLDSIREEERELRKTEKKKTKRGSYKGIIRAGLLSCYGSSFGGAILAKKLPWIGCCYCCRCSLSFRSLLFFSFLFFFLFKKNSKHKYLPEVLSVNLMPSKDT